MLKTEGTIHSLIYTETTGQIRVTVEPEYVEDYLGSLSEGPPEEGHHEEGYAFSYTVTIENRGTTSVQLVDRHWIVSSGGAHCTEIRGEGVVGTQPVIEPGAEFQYTSWAVIKDPIGTMFGTYTFSGSDGEQLSVKIPEFDLVYPLMLH